MNGQMAQASVSVSKAHETGAALLVDVWYGGSQYQLEMPEATAAESEGDGNDGGLVRTPMPGKVLKVLVAAGQRVAAGEPVAVVEAMKMEHTLRAGRSGVVSKLSCTEGGQVRPCSELPRVPAVPALSPPEMLKGRGSLSSAPRLGKELNLSGGHSGRGPGRLNPSIYSTHLRP